MNAYQYDTLSQENQSVKVIAKPNKFIINRRNPVPYIKEVINENEYERSSKFPPIKKYDKVNESSFSTLQIPQLNLKHQKELSSQNSRSLNLKNNLSTSIGQSEQNVPVYNE